MAGNTNFPTAVDDDTSLYDVTDTVTSIVAAHHNNIKEAVKKMQAKMGIYNTAAPTSLDYRLGHPTSSHAHNGASGQGRLIDASTILSAVGPARHVVNWYYQGSIPSGASLGAPFQMGRTMQLENISANVRRAPSGATLGLDVNFGPTSIYAASVGFKPIFPAGTLAYGNASPNLVTYASGVLIIVDADAVGTSEPGTDLSITFVFKD